MYTIIISERQRLLLHTLLAEFAALVGDGQDTPFDVDETADLLNMEDMLNPDGSTGPLEPSPAVNSFVL